MRGWQIGGVVVVIALAFIVMARASSICAAKGGVFLPREGVCLRGQVIR
jgi:hypothetical protein